MIKNFLSIAILMLMSVAANAHPGHTEKVDGHTHSLMDLVFMSATPIALIVGAVALIAFLRGRKS